MSGLLIIYVCNNTTFIISGISLKYTQLNPLRPGFDLKLLTPSSHDDLQTILSNGKEGVTIFITGLPANDSLADLIKSYKCRNSDNLFIFDLASELRTIEDIFTLDFDFVGDILVNNLIDIARLTPYYNIHLIGSGVGSHVAGSAARMFYQQTGYKLPRITALDPTKTCQQFNQTIIGLHRGDADFVDVIHTSSLGLGTLNALGDADFYPNGPTSIMTGVNSLMESSNLAVKYFAETVIPGQEHNFLAVEDYSMEHFKKHKNLGPKVIMGYMVQKNIRGIFFLDVNKESPYGLNGLRNQIVYCK